MSWYDEPPMDHEEQVHCHECGGFGPADEEPRHRDGCPSGGWYETPTKPRIEVDDMRTIAADFAVRADAWKLAHDRRAHVIHGHHVNMLTSSSPAGWQDCPHPLCRQAQRDAEAAEKATVETLENA